MSAREVFAHIALVCAVAIVLWDTGVLRQQRQVIDQQWQFVELQEAALHRYRERFGSIDHADLLAEYRAQYGDPVQCRCVEHDDGSYDCIATILGEVLPRETSRD